MKVAGSLLSLRGIKVTGASGLTAALGAVAAGGGDTSRVADLGRVEVVKFATDALEGAGLTAADPLLVVCVLVLGMSVLTETSGVFWADVGLVIVGAVLSWSSFSLFAIGSESYIAAAGDGGRVLVGFVES